jgi:hypothetical protein
MITDARGAASRPACSLRRNWADRVFAPPPSREAKVPPQPALPSGFQPEAFGDGHTNPAALRPWLAASRAGLRPSGGACSSRPRVCSRMRTRKSPSPSSTARDLVRCIGALLNAPAATAALERRGRRFRLRRNAPEAARSELVHRLLPARGLAAGEGERAAEEIRALALRPDVERRRHLAHLHRRPRIGTASSLVPSWRSLAQDGKDSRLQTPGSRNCLT